MITGWIVAYLCRWLPHAAPTGLFPIGSPNEDSPVIVTANFSLTVRRVRRALRRQDVWLLVVNTHGINVWCAAAGGAFTEHRVIDAIKVSDLSNKVTGRVLVLPALAAAGIDRKAIRRATGFHAHFGPVYAEDIPAYLDAGRKKNERMCRFRFDLKHRLEMLPAMNFPMYLPIALVVALLWPSCLLGLTALFWSAVAVLYLFVNVIPGKTGWGQAVLAAAMCVLGWASLDWALLDDPLQHWGWFLAAFAIFLAGGLDLAGIATARKSDPEQLLIRIGVKRLGSLYNEKTLGNISLDHQKCKGCGTCREICPLGVFGDLEQSGKTAIRAPNVCFACGACVKQCPESALRFA